MRDVCLILEGTYPYVTGGVSTCVHQLIEQTPHINYILVYIGAVYDPDAFPKYEIPENVKAIKHIYLYEYEDNGELEEIPIKADFDLLYDFYKKIQVGDTSLFKDVYMEFFNPQSRKFSPMKFIKSKQSWDFVTKLYNESFASQEGLSFIDFFYSWRFSHLPIFKLLDYDIPKASLYHSLCTGYAGLLASAASLRFNKPLFLTEHGIYSHEREIEIFQAEWIHGNEEEIKAVQNLSYFKEWWIKIFHFMGKLAYDNASSISTLYNGNKLKQISHGAIESKIEIIPNGIDVKKFSELVEGVEKNSEKLTIALVGRVVPIKDIKTFIKSILVLKSKLDNFEFLIVGLTDEDEDYFNDCVRLVSLLGLEDEITFTGKVNMMKYYPQIDLIVLSSISEGQPMVILEGFACSIPVVSTDVGSCSELIYGSGDDDIAIGKAGVVVPFGDADKLGEAMYSVLSDKDKYKQMQKSAFKMVNKYFREELTIQKYLNMYNKHLARGTN